MTSFTKLSQCIFFAVIRKITITYTLEPRPSRIKLSSSVNRTQKKMTKLGPKLAFCLIFLVFESSLCCESSYDALYDLQNILKHRRKAGRIHPRNRIIETIVRTKMECLDICLRTSQCASFTLKAVRYKRGTRTAWICLINKEANFSQKMAKHDSKGFIHFSMSASKLQQVSYFFSFVF